MKKDVAHKHAIPAQCIPNQLCTREYPQLEQQQWRPSKPSAFHVGASPVSTEEEHDPSELMRRVRDHLASTCEITKDTPFAVKALSGDVVMKCRIYRDDDGLFFDCRRYRGDALHFVDMWRRLCESESLGARARG